MPDAGFAQALRGREEISITVIGRRSGRRITLPVWFVTARGTLWLLPVRGSRSQWFRNLVVNPTITVHAGRPRTTTMARLVRNRRTVQGVVAKFRRKYSPQEIREYYSRFEVAIAVPVGA